MLSFNIGKNKWAKNVTCEQTLMPGTSSICALFVSLQLKLFLMAPFCQGQFRFEVAITLLYFCAVQIARVCELSQLPLVSTPHPLLITARKRSLGQGNIFTGVCLFKGGGIGFPACITGHMTGGSASIGGFTSRGVCVQREGVFCIQRVCLRGEGVPPWGEGDSVYGGRGSAFGGSASGGVTTRPLPRTTRYSQRAGGMQYTRYWNSFLLILSTSQYIMLFLSIQQTYFLCNLILKHQN